MLHMDEAWKCNGRWKKPVTEDHILYDCLNEMSRIGKFVETESRLVLAVGLGEVEEWKLIAYSHRVLFLRWLKNVITLNFRYGCMMHVRGGTLHGNLYNM